MRVEKLDETSTRQSCTSAKVIALSFFLYRPLFFSQALIWLTECRAHGAVRAAAVLEPTGVVVILQTLHGVGERERDVHLDLIVGLVGAVTARGGTGAEMHRRQGLVPYQLVGVVGDAMGSYRYSNFSTSLPDLSVKTSVTPSLTTA